VQQAGRLLAANGERYLLPGDTMARLFADRPDAVAETVAFLARIQFDLGQLKYEYPHEAVPEGWNAQDWLQNIVLQAALLRYPGGLPGKMCRLLYEEFGLIRARNYACYFLTVYDGRSADIMPGAGIGGQFGGLLPARRHFGRSDGIRPVILALRVERTRRAARYRRGFRA
jgi:DNA polymerase III alpha subunit